MPALAIAAQRRCPTKITNQNPLLGISWSPRSRGNKDDDLFKMSYSGPTSGISWFLSKTELSSNIQYLNCTLWSQFLGLADFKHSACSEEVEAGDDDAVSLSSSNVAPPWRAMQTVLGIRTYIFIQVTWHTKKRPYICNSFFPTGPIFSYSLKERGSIEN